MATLRNPLFRQSTVTADDLDALRASGMNPVTRGWESGRIGADINANYADEASLRAEGTQKALTRADALRAENEGLRRRQSIYSPEVQRVEDIDGVGTGLSWLGGQVGQGAASMADTLAAGTALQAAGTAAGFVPGPVGKAASLALRGAGYVVPAMMNQRQLKGEFYGDVSQDPTVMQQHSAEELNSMANRYGTIASIPDTVIPGMIGSKLGGSGLFKGISKIPGGLRTTAELLGEGITEYGQEKGKQYAHGILNPNRDTSGDASANLNSFLGGMAGAGAPILAGHAADSGFRRAGATARGTADLVKDAAGSVVDMYDGSKLQGAVDTGAEKAGGLFKRGKDAVVDLKNGDLKAKDIIGDLKQKTAEGADNLKAALEERDLLNGVAMENIPADAPDFEQQFGAFQERRAKLIADKLMTMSDSDPKAAELYHRAFESGASAAAQDAVFGEAADYLMEKSNINELAKKASRAGGVAGKVAGFAGKVLRQAGDAGVTLGKAAWDGFAQGGKKNAQWSQEDVDAEMAGRKDAGARALSLQRAKLMSEFLAERTRQEEARIKSAAPDANIDHMASYMGDVGFEIANLADNLGLTGKKPQTQEQPNRAMDSTKLALNRIANTLNSAYGNKAKDTLAEIQTMAAPGSEPLFQLLGKELDTVQSKAGAKETYALRRWAQDELIKAVDPDTRLRLMKNGIDLNSGAGKRQLLGMVEAIATGRVKPGFDKELAKVIGKGNLEAMLEVIERPVAEDTDAESGMDANDGETFNGMTLDDDGEYREAAQSSYDVSQAEDKFHKGTGGRMYGFYGVGARYDQSGADGVQRVDPFAPASKATKAQIQAWEDNNRQRRAEGLAPDYENDPRAGKRPRLIPMNEDGTWNDAAATNRVNNRLGGENWRVRTVPALEVLKESNAQPARILALYRDYLRDEMSRSKDDAANKVSAETVTLLNKAVMDNMDQAQGNTKELRLTPGIRKRLMAEATQFFSERGVVMADRLSDREVSELNATDVMALAREGAKQQERISRDGPAAAQNLLAFRTTNLGPQAKDGTGGAGVIYIPAGKLVNLVRQRNAASVGTDFENTGGRMSNKDKNEAYLRDLMTGISMLIGSGHVEGMPQMMGEGGKRYSFKNGIPPVLRLATTTVEKLNQSKEMKLKDVQRRDPVHGAPNKASPDYDARSDEGYQLDVSIDQMKNEDWFSPDSRVEQEPSGYERRRAMSDAEYAHWAGLKTELARKAYLNKLRDQHGEEWSAKLDEYGVHGTQFATFADLNDTVERGEEGGGRYDGRRVTDNRTEVKPHQARTNKDNRTQLDMQRKPKGGKSETGALDEYADQRARSVSQGYTADGEALGRAFPKGRMDDQGKFHGDELAQTFKSDFEEGVAQAQMWLKMAQAPVYDKKGVTGGAHLTMPVAVALSADNIASMDLGVNEAKQVQALRTQVLSVLQASDLSKRDKLKVAKAIVPANARDKLNQFNLDKFLAKNAATDVEVKAETKTAPAASAKEAGAPVGKSQSKPDGADWSKAGQGRKLNRQAQEIHEDLGKFGFAATHDSPHLFDGKFNWRKHALKGEGAMAFGAGTYLSTSDGVHRSYKKAFTEAMRKNVDLQWDGETFTMDEEYNEPESSGDAAKDAVIYQIMVNGLDPQEAQVRAVDSAFELVDRSARDLVDTMDVSLPPEVNDSDATRNLFAKLLGRQELTESDVRGYEAFLNRERWNRMVENAEKKRTAIRKLDVSGITVRGFEKSPTYQVSVDIDPHELLDWDAPFDAQSDHVKEALRAAGVNVDIHVKDLATGVTTIKRGALAGEHIYRNLVQRKGSQAAASDYLQSLGILGHKYAAEGGKNDAHPNYVIYDDNRIHTNYVHFNAQNGSDRVSTWQERSQALNYVRHVLGNQIKVDFADITGYSGEWVDAAETIRISTTAAAGAMQTAYHEALHGFFSKFVKNEPRAFEVLKSLAEDRGILERVHALLDGYPDAQAQLTDGEERLAYIYQFWASGLLDLPTKPKNLFQKLLRFFRGVLGRITDSERATALLEAFHEGKFGKDPSAAGQVIAKAINEGMATTKMARKVDGVVQKVRSATMPANSILLASDSKEAQALARDFWTNPGEGAVGGEAEGYLNARLREARRYTNLFSDYIKGLTDRDLKDITKYLQQGTEPADIPYAPHRKAVKQVRGLLGRFYKYMTAERGMDIGNLGDKYFPRVWSATALYGQEPQFINMLMTKYGDVLQGGVNGSGGKLTREQVAQRIFNKLAGENIVADTLPPSRDDGVLAPFFANKEIRELKWLADADAEPFLSKDLIQTLTTYFHNGARSAEYTARFGQKGEHLDQRLKTVNNELSEAALARLKKGEFKDRAAADKWAERQMQQVQSALGAMEGTLGKDINATWRNASNWMTVYQNVRLLPMALFASVVDPLGMVARGATMKEAYDTFLRGMTEVVRDWGDLFRDQPKERQADQWEKLALAVGSVDAAMFSHHVSEEYSSDYMGKTPKRINDAFFKLNGMEAWNRGSRVGATRSAALFIQRHSKLPETHSARWLAELGLKPKDITLDDNGELITDKQTLMAKKGISESQAEQEIDKLYYAIGRWVEGAIITPNAAQRPAWSSDPHWSMFFHLKQFTYSFHQTILKRAVKEMEYGNMAPIGSFLWYVPVMIASDLTKGLVQGGGELPSHMKGMDMGDWIMRGAERAGLLGVGQIGVDAGQDLFSLGGPAVEQIIDGFTDPLAKTTLNALPAHALYAEALK